ncbi:MAG: hypothetical protein KME60_16525 [Cyanomargarita calcarea GSE-NOS-MK-12-04C]|uniref:Zinc finger C3HC4 RING-type domain-containing protein n=1 Tax=Cyanomargarita calcarea GSE-NOS-MK-12-04C TaxID=2839659 RepID=A0A951QPX6_9CYAN|nr:hypothetical protein [Cyanomargarita calcarea GSE-NOS-MK-12-04C]
MESATPKNLNSFIKQKTCYHVFCDFCLSKLVLREAS